MASISPADAEKTSPAAAAEGPRPQSAAQAWQQVAAQIGQIRAFAWHLIDAKLDVVRLTIRQLVIYAALGVVGLAGLCAVAVMMVVFLFQGIAGGFGELFNGRLWLGDLVTMGIFALLVVAVGSIALGSIRKASRRRTVEKYEARQSQQRINYGTDAHERATRA
jgi:hypothetical protein